MFSDTFAGIAPASALGFVAAQILGGGLAVLAIRALYPHVTAADAAAVVIPHPNDDHRHVTVTAIPDGGAPVSTVLFVCLHNAGRSQMSQALFERSADGRHTAVSAGTMPGDRVHPEVVKVMRELGIELADRKPQLLTRELAEQSARNRPCPPACAVGDVRRTASCADSRLAHTAGHPAETASNASASARFSCVTVSLTISW